MNQLTRMSQDLDALRLALQHSPDNIPLNLLYAKGCIDEGILDAASECYDKVLGIDESHTEAKLGSGARKGSKLWLFK